MRFDYDQLSTASQSLVDHQTKRPDLRFTVVITCVLVMPVMWVHSLADDRVHPGGVALGYLEAGQSAGFDDKVIYT